jgi:hypothetical protein
MTATWRGLEQVDVVLEHLGRVPAQGEGGHLQAARAEPFVREHVPGHARQGMDALA